MSANHLDSFCAPQKRNAVCKRANTIAKHDHERGKAPSLVVPIVVIVGETVDPRLRVNHIPDLDLLEKVQHFDCVVQVHRGTMVVLRLVERNLQLGATELCVGWIPHLLPRSPQMLDITVDKVEPRIVGATIPRSNLFSHPAPIKSRRSTNLTLF